MQPSAPHASHLPLLLRSSNHSPVAGRYRPIFAVPLPFQSPVTGRSPNAPNDFTHLSNLQFFHCPSPLRSKNHSPVAGRKVPIFAVPVPFQSPTTGKSPLSLGNLRQPSELQLSSMPSPLRSKYHFGVRPEITAPI